MDLSNEHQIPAPRSRVWAALNDAEVLRQSIPGCEDLEQIDERTMRARVRSKVGPIGVRFNGVVELSDVDPDHGYKISFRGEGGAAGFVKGNAVVALHDADGGTLLSYTAQAQIGGRLAQIGSRLIDSVAAKTAAEFFDRFSEFVVDGGVTKASAPGRIGAPGGSPNETDVSASLALTAWSDTHKLGLALAVGAVLGWLVGRRRD